MQGATPCLLARYSHSSNSWIFVQNIASRSHDFICFQPRKKLFHSSSIRLGSSIVPLRSQILHDRQEQKALWITVLSFNVLSEIYLCPRESQLYKLLTINQVQ